MQPNQIEPLDFDAGRAGRLDVETDRVTRHQILRSSSSTTRLRFTPIHNAVAVEGETVPTFAEHARQQDSRPLLCFPLFLDENFLRLGAWAGNAFSHVQK